MRRSDRVTTALVPQRRLTLNACSSRERAAFWLRCLSRRIVALDIHLGGEECLAIHQIGRVARRTFIRSSVTVLQIQLPDLVLDPVSPRFSECSKANGAGELSFIAMFGLDPRIHRVGHGWPMTGSPDPARR